MQFATIIKDGREAKGQILILTNAEAKELYNTQVEYCAQNPRKRKAKAVLKEYEDNLVIWG